MASPLLALPSSLVDDEQAPAPLPTTDPGAMVPANPTAIRVDREPPVYQGLIHKAGDRQSTTLSLEFGDDTRVQGFVARPRDARLDLFDRREVTDYRLQGAAMTGRLVRADGADVRLTSAWLHGSKRTGDWLMPAERHDNDAWSVAGDARLWADRLAMSVEYAGSRSARERHGEAQATSVSAGDAYRAELRLQPKRSPLADWELGASYEYIEADFASLANPGLARDRARLSTFSRARFGELGVDIGYREEHANLAQTPGNADRRWRWADITTTWEPDFPGLPALLRNPRIKLSTKLGERRLDAPADASATERSDVYRGDVRLESAFATPYGDWDLDVRARRLPGALDAAEPGGLASLQLRVAASEFAIGGLPARSRVSWLRDRDRITGTQHETWGTEVALDRIDLGRGLVGGLDIRLRHRFGGESPRGAQRIAGSLEWTLRPPTASGAGLKLSLNGAWLGGDSGSLAIDGEDDLYLGLRIVAGGDLDDD